MSTRSIADGGLTESDEAEIGGLHTALIAAANGADAAGFAAPFSDTADFIEFEGTHLVGARQIEAFHQPFFETLLRGWRFGGRVQLVRPIGSSAAVMVATATTTLPGREQPSPGRDAVQLVVATKRAGRWCIEAMQNGRRIGLERQQLLDELDAGEALDRRAR